MDIYFLKQFEHHILAFTVSLSTLNRMQNIYMQYLLISFIGDIYLKYLRTGVGCEFENLFFTIRPGHILYMEYPFGHCYGKTY